MSVAVCFFHETIYCWDSPISSGLVPCGPMVMTPVGLSLPVCSCDRGHLTGASNCYCPIGSILSVCQANCRDNRDCNQQQQFSEISDYIKVLLGLVTVIFFVTLYVAIKRYIRRRNGRNVPLSSATARMVNVQGCPQYICQGQVWSTLNQPPSYDEVNSTPPPYELVVKSADSRNQSNPAEIKPENSNQTLTENSNLATHISIGFESGNHG